MLAAMGYITPEVAGKFPGYLSPSAGLKFADVPNGLAALSKVPGGGWTQILLYMSWCEVSRGAGSDIASGRPGDFGWYVLTSADPEAKKKKLSAELANGRLAMMAIIGMFYQDGLTGSAWGDWANYTDSPLRAEAVDFSSQLGVTPPLGFFDPLGLSKFDDPEVAKQQFKRRRTIEIQHGRVAMLACMGYIVPEYVRFPGFCSPSQNIAFADIPNGLKAAPMVPLIGWTQIVGFVGVIEILNLQKIQEGDVLGDYGYGAFGLPFGKKIEDKEKKMKSLNAEINNGRLAMMAIIGMFFQDGLTGSAWGDWANYADSPLRAFESELGVQAPVGFWDPVGYTRDGSTESFKRRRETEVKHGRVAMYATMGYIVPEYFKWPGYLSPSMGLKFADVPNGFAAITKVPGNGWAQIVAFAGYYELFVYKFNGTPGDYGWKAISSPDAEVKKRKLNAELANGRLAMMAIIGMFFQDGLTGTAWGDWANYTDSPLRAEAVDFSSQLGVTPPLGFFDPLGLSKFDDPEVAKQQFKRRRTIEIQHGRVAMLACMGYIVPEYVRFPGFCSPSQNIAFADIPNGLKAAPMVPLIGWTQIVGFVGVIEILNLQKIQEGDVLGDYGYGAFGLPFGKKIEDKEKKMKSLNAEINNGRLAMMAIIGMFFQDGLTGSAWGDWANYADSPLRAFESELGVQAPVGFWDPVGYTRDGSAESFKRRRETEVKHGRVAMYATMGYIVPEYFKWPGYLSPSMGLKFADVPNGFAAITKVPGNGWAQIVAFAGYYELFVYKFNGTPGDYGWKAISSPDAEVKKRKLNAELANGRLAMMAIIGMFFQDGLTGTAWGDWANYTDSPLRAFESETGVQPPVGFWDPLGLSASGNLSDFKRRREVELKHGRVAMFATIGYILPEYWRFPGYLSKFLDVKFADVPNGLGAFSKVPALGWLQIVGFAGIVEINIYNEQVNDDEPGNYGAGFLGLRSVGIMNSGITDPEVRKKKLNAELANGRLAMMAIIGMFFQDGLTGSAWGDWANYTASPLR
ncbi:unnamed protein product [Effrenium voratum]|uniref:Light-harvesting protein n=1 Tax=Effrenium voratum TaxID=2562239 RepID=A0AA36N9Z7_9DINO|nr:unnamed protein product [Effrenium voratum]CAJ1444991.1 unnamed protein product [Effrenium voratum]